MTTIKQEKGSGTPSQHKLKEILIGALAPFTDNKADNQYIPAIITQVDTSSTRRMSNLLKKVQELRAAQEPKEVRQLANLVYKSGFADLLTNAGLPEPLIFKMLNQLAGLPVAYLGSNE